MAYGYEVRKVATTSLMAVTRRTSSSRSRPAAPASARLWVPWVTDTASSTRTKVPCALSAATAAVKTLSTETAARQDVKGRGVLMHRVALQAFYDRHCCLRQALL